MKLQFGTNVPIEVCLMTLDGETVESQYGGPQRKYTTTDRDTFYVSDMVGNIIAETCRKLKIEEREPVVICKAEVSDGRGRKAIRWQVTRVSAPHPQVGPQPDGGFAARRAPTTNTNGANGSYPPAPPVAPTTQVQQPVPVINGNGTANGNNGSARRILGDQEITLLGYGQLGEQGLPLRRIEVWDEERQEKFVFVTNHLRWTASTIDLEGAQILPAKKRF